MKRTSQAKLDVCMPLSFFQMSWNTTPAIWELQPSKRSAKPHGGSHGRLLPPLLSEVQICTGSDMFTPSWYAECALKSAHMIRWCALHCIYLLTLIKHHFKAHIMNQHWLNRLAYWSKFTAQRPCFIFAWCGFFRMLMLMALTTATTPPLVICYPCNSTGWAI